MDTSQTWAVEWIPLDRVYLSPSNPRKNDEAVGPVAASLRRFGWKQPIVAKRSGEVIAGNTRLKAAKSLGMTTVPVVWFEGTDLDATAYQIADNKTHEFAEWDEPALAKLLRDLRTRPVTPSKIELLIADHGAKEVTHGRCKSSEGQRADRGRTCEACRQVPKREITAA